jgi:intein/homing endonuclease
LNKINAKTDWRKQEREREINWFYKFSISQIWFHEFEQINKQPMEKRPPFLQIAG